MRPVLWQTLAGTPGGHSRLRILYLLSERPQNANRLAKELSLNALVKDIVGESENSSDDFFQGFSSGFA